MTEKPEKYYSLLEQWMKYYGYSGLNVHADSGINVDKVFKKSEFKASRFGNLDTYCCIKYIKEANGNDLQSFSKNMFDMASQHRKGAPLALGAMLVVYPLLITENISYELADFLKNYCPEHAGAAEFPSVLDLVTGYLYYYEKTPAWGSIYYNTYRSESYHLYSPKAWSEINNVK